jgi:hypothetical protein
LLTDCDEMSNPSGEPSTDASYQVSVQLAMQFQRRIFFRIQLIRNKNCLWWPCLLTDRNEMNYLYRGPSIDASYLVRFIWLCNFRGEYCFRNQPIRNKNCLWRPCLLTDWDEMSNLHRGPSIDASCLDSVHLAIWFQRRICFFNCPIRNKNCLSRPCLLTDCDEMSNLHGEPSTDASYQVSVQLAMRFQRRIFF